MRYLQKGIISETMYRLLVCKCSAQSTATRTEERLTTILIHGCDNTLADNLTRSLRCQLYFYTSTSDGKFRLKLQSECDSHSRVSVD